MSSGEDRRRSSIHDDNAYYQNVHSSSRHKKEHRSRSKIRSKEKHSVSSYAESTRKDDRKDSQYAEQIKWENNLPNDIPSILNHSASKELSIQTDRGAFFSPIEYAELEKFCQWTGNRTRDLDENDDAILQRIVNLEQALLDSRCELMSYVNEKLSESEAKNEPLVDDEVDPQSSSDLPKEQKVVEKLGNKNTLVMGTVCALNEEINQIRSENRRYEREIKNLKQRIERLEMSRSPNRSRRSQNSRRERSVQSCECRRRSPKRSSSRESSQSQNRELFEASKSSNRSCGSLYSRKETSASKRTSTDRTRDRRRRSPSHPSSRESSQSHSSCSRERGEQFKTSKSLNRSCGSQYSRKETSVSKRTSTDRTYERRTRSRSRSSSRESSQSQDCSHRHKQRDPFKASKSLNRSCGSQYSRKETSVSKRKAPSAPAHCERPRIQSDKEAGTNISSRYLESPGIVDKEQNCYESKARLDPEELTADPDNKSCTSKGSKETTPSKKPDQNKALESVDLQKFPYDEFELIGDSLSHYLAHAVWKMTSNVRKPYLQEQITLTALYNSIKPVTFTKRKAIVSMAQFELNALNTYYKIVQEKVKKVIDLLIEKGFEKIIILFPVIKPVTGNQKPVSMSSYFMYIRAFELVCDYKRVTLWWKPAAVFLQLKKDERRPGKMTFDEDENGNMIPIKSKFHRNKLSGKLYPDRDQKHEVLVEIDKLYRSEYFSGKRPEMDFAEE